MPRQATQEPSSVSQPTIGLDVSPLHGAASVRGLGRVTGEIVRALKLLGIDYVNIPGPRGIPDRVEPFIGSLSRSRVCRAASIDLYHASHPLTPALFPGVPTVASILDIIPLEIASYRRTGIKNRAMFCLSARSEIVLTISDYSATRIADKLGVDPSRIVVAPLPVSEHLVHRIDDAPTRGIPTPPYVFALADLRAPDPRKRSVYLETIAAELASSGCELKVAGPDTEHWAARNLRGLGRVSDPELATLYAKADAFVFTSAFEGQGMPVLEAMLLGTPVVAARNTSVTELLADYPFWVDEIDEPAIAANGPHSPHDEMARRFAERTSALIGSPATRAQLVEVGRRIAATYSAERFAVQLQAAYRLALGQ